MANKWLYVSSNLSSTNNTYAQGTSGNEFSIEGSPNLSITEAAAQSDTSVEYTVDDGYIRISSNNIDNTSTLNFRDDAANVGPAVSITANTTGVFEEGTSATIASGSLINWNLVVGAGAHGDVLGPFIISAVLSESAGGTPTFVASRGSINALVTQATTEYVPFQARLTADELTDANVQYTLRYAPTISNLSVYVSSNDVAAASSVTLRDDAADTSLVASITADTTGRFEDNTNTTSVASGSEINYSITAGIDVMGGSVSVENISAKSSSTSKNLISHSVTNTFSFGTTSYSPISGSTVESTTESDAQCKPRFALSLRNLFFKVSANTIDGTTDVTVRVNAGNSALTQQVASLTTGDFEDTADTVAVASTDEINYSISTSGTLGTITIYSMGVEMFEVAAAPAAPLPSGGTVPHRMLLGVGL